MEINERFIKLNGKIPIPPGFILEADNDYPDVKVIVDGLPFLFEHVIDKHPNNKDGTKDLVHEFKFHSSI